MKVPQLVSIIGLGIIKNYKIYNFFGSANDLSINIHLLFCPYSREPPAIPVPHSDVTGIDGSAVITSLDTWSGD